VIVGQLKIVVIGGVAAGPKAAARAKRCNPNAKVTIVEKGQWLSYGGCGLPYFLGATVKELKDLMSTSWEAERTPKFFKEAKDIDVLMGWEAVKIDRSKKTVLLSNVETQEKLELDYDKLVLATGAETLLPPIPGIDSFGVFQLKNPGHALAMKEYMMKNHISNAIIIGGGLIGIETAEAIANWGMDVTIVEMQEHILPSLLDKELAMALTNYLEKEDLNIQAGTTVKKILTDETGKVKGVETDKGIIEGQMVLVSVGVRPNVKLAQEAGLEVERGIIVNEYLETSDPDIYACGDCVVSRIFLPAKGFLFPLVPQPINRAELSAPMLPAAGKSSPAFWELPLPKSLIGM